ncbi:ATP-dependent DNA helicase RecG [uncultured Tessaracoccus sp.]|uniref:ATP-dependent DNA helicase RecG n=1 Tax=uncultured Tessaracoccus sp. TaxID=905023 RepID=UPI0026304A29|nr:ATP-dependent DNA helicase RecG [uncultured Tessaracoccus sp.]
MFRTPIYRELARSLPDVVGAATAKKLAAIGLHTLDDLLRHVPRRYISGTQMSSFQNLREGEDVAVIAKVVHSSVVYGRKTRVVATIADEAGRELSVTLFVPGAKAQFLADYWKNLLRPGDRGLFAGKVSVFRDQLQLSHPDFVMLDGARITGRKDRKRSAKQQAGEDNRQAMGRMAQRATMVGIYPATSTFQTWMVAETIQMLLPTIDGETLPQWVLEEAGQPTFEEALRSVHEPVDVAEAGRGIDRLRFDEAFGIQLAMAHRRATMASEAASPRTRTAGGLLDTLDERLPFALTDDQRSVGETIFDELARSTPMHRLLQGEVGSGKTLVALRAMCAVVDAGGQAVLVAPTEVLAKQHFGSIKTMLGELGEGRTLAQPRGTHVTLLTGSMSTAEKREALNCIVTGEAGIVVGTHALFSNPVTFFDLGLVVIDEQHRFGVEQRAALSKKASHKPHTLVMTATPIPRSIAMTIFGDLAVSELRQLPRGREDVQTVFVNTLRHPAWVDRAWERIREEVAAGRQAFVVCPAITPEQTSIKGDEQRMLASVTELAAKLESGPLEGLRIGMVHGQQPTAERDETMRAFSAGEVDVIVATTVVEVGVDVPNASVMVVLDADRFGISQLHQLRGRIGRGSHKGLCLLMAPLRDEDEQARTRLEAVEGSRDGFHLAEVDLELRREGDVLGVGQSGGSSLKILRIADVELIQQAKVLAERVVDDPRAGDDPLLADLLDQAAQVAAGEWLEKG